MELQLSNLEIWSPSKRGMGENELFIVVENMYDKDVMSPRLRIIDSTGRISKYPIWWFKIVQRFYELQQ